MRKLYWAVPFLIYDAVLLFWAFVFSNVMVVLLNFLTFMLEYRYGGESKESEELVVFSIALSSLLLPLGGVFSSFALLLAGFVFFLELAVVFLKTHLVNFS